MAGAGYRERPENVNIYQLSDFAFESWRGLSLSGGCVLLSECEGQIEAGTVEARRVTQSQSVASLR